MLIKESSRKALFALSALAALVALLVAGAGVIDQSLYQPSTPDSMLPGAVSQDIVSILAAVGILLCILFIRRGKNLAWLFWLGLLSYLFYAYALYSFGRVYNPLFLCYIAIVGLTVYSMISFFRSANLKAIAPVAGRKAPPRRSTAALLLVLVTMFLFLWLSILIPAMGSRVSPDGDPIFVLDLAFFLPLLTIVAVLLFRKHPLGDALAIPLLIKMGTLGISVMLGALLAPAFGRELDVASVGIYALLGVGPLVFAVPFVQRMTVGGERQQPS